MLKGQPLREILVIVHLIVPLTTGCHELFNLLKGNLEVVPQVTTRIPETRVRLREAVVLMTNKTVQQAVIIITVDKAVNDNLS
jgi:hypothetical protein